jgi:anhydro-N-acetylmuramic acid kinase
MTQQKSALWAIGLMSGTSMDGIDAALIKTDGNRVLEFGAALSVAYDVEFRQSFARYLGTQSAPEAVIQEFTEKNIGAVKQLLEKADIPASDISVIGFHGQTLYHEPAKGITVQIGDGAHLAQSTGIDVIDDFRTADVKAGGEGAPLAPLYHQALARSLEKPLAVLNLGGVGNVTYLDDDGILAFDTGPASALIDDWVRRHANIPFDEGGHIARKGIVDISVLKTLLDMPYFNKTPPKSLDRDEFQTKAIEALSLEDGAATLTAFTIGAIEKTIEHLPQRPKRWLITGGGRHNVYFMELLAQRLQVPVEPVEAVGWRGDELEAEAFAFLAVRSLFNMPLSLPNTTGVSEALTGGTLHPACKM